MFNIANVPCNRLLDVTLRPHYEHVTSGERKMSWFQSPDDTISSMVRMSNLIQVLDDEVDQVRIVAVFINEVICILGFAEIIEMYYTSWMKIKYQANNVILLK